MLSLNVLSRICSWFWQEALQRSRPDFISRSQSRVQELERRTQERRELANVTDPQSAAVVKQKRAHSIRSTSLKGIMPPVTLTSPLVLLFVQYVFFPQKILHKTL